MTTAKAPGPSPDETLKLLACGAVAARDQARKTGKPVITQKNGFQSAVWWEGNQLCISIVKEATPT